MNNTKEYILFPVLILIFVAFVAISFLQASEVSAVTGDKWTKSYEIHSFIHSTFSTGAKTYLFDAAQRTGKELTRFDFPMNIIEPQKKNFSWTLMDQNVQMARDRNLAVVGTLNASAAWAVKANDTTPFDGPIDPNKMNDYTTFVKTVVARYPDILYWEVWNEPNLGGGLSNYKDHPDWYAKLLKTAFNAVKQANPNAQVLLGGLAMNSSTQSWMNAVVFDPLNPGLNNFDIANVHIRGTIQGVTSQTTQARAYVDSIGRTDAPLWVTEHGYPANPIAQTDPNYQYGDLAQADYYTVSLPAMINAGAIKIFVTLRDMATNEGACITDPNNAFCSEGLVTFATIQSTTGIDRPSMATFQGLVPPP